MISARAATVATACLGLASCATRGALIAPSLTPEADRTIELTQTPFYPQEKFQCGPAALAIALGASGVTIAPEELAPLLYLPSRRGSLQIELSAAPRSYARLAYQLTPDLSAILAELEQHRPVVVLHNYGLAAWPHWHYAVVVGYDSRHDTLILRSGTTRRQVMSARRFMLAWDNADRWAIVVLRPGELPAVPNRARYLEAAAEFEHAAMPQDARLAFDAALKLWPDEALGWIGRGTAEYHAHDLAAAAADYATALRIDGSNSGARNNLAMTLLDLGCTRQAHIQIEQIDLTALTDTLRTAVEDSRRQVDARWRENSGAEPSACTQYSH